METLLLGLLVNLEQRCITLRERLRNLNAHQDVSRHAIDTYRMVEELRRKVSRLLTDPSLGAPQLIPNHLQQYKRWSEEAFLIESYPFPFIERYSSADQRLYNFGRKLADQVGWQLAVPIVGTFSNQYFWTSPGFAVICGPVGAGEDLLALPDFCHEMGHILLLHHEQTLVNGFSAELAKYIEEQRRRITSQQRPPGYRPLYDQLFVQWQERWVWEFASDMVAAYLVGPAFGWQHIRLCMGLSETAYYPSLGQSAEHPADSARLIGILAVLEQLGHVDSAQRLQRVWEGYLAAVGETKPADYDVCYPQELIQWLAEHVAAGCRTLGLRAYEAETDPAMPMYLPSLLNEAWERFLADSITYGQWEQDRLEHIWKELG